METSSNTWPEWSAYARVRFCWKTVFASSCLKTMPFTRNVLRNASQFSRVHRLIELLFVRIKKLLRSRNNTKRTRHHSMETNPKIKVKHRSVRQVKDEWRWITLAGRWLYDWSLIDYFVDCLSTGGVIEASIVRCRKSTTSLFLPTNNFSCCLISSRETFTFNRSSSNFFVSSAESLDVMFAQPDSSVLSVARASGPTAGLNHSRMEMPVLNLKSLTLLSSRVILSLVYEHIHRLRHLRRHPTHQLALSWLQSFLSEKTDKSISEVRKRALSRTH